MKIWKYIIGVLAALGGILALSSSNKKKELNKKVQDNEEKIKIVKAKAKVVEQKKNVAKAKASKSKAKAKTLDKQLKDTKTSKDIVDNFEKKHRKRGRPPKNKA